LQAAAFNAGRAELIAEKKRRSLGAIQCFGGRSARPSAFSTKAAVTAEMTASIGRATCSTSERER
jgi:hypothetical protein